MAINDELVKKLESEAAKTKDTKIKAAIEKKLNDLKNGVTK